MFPCVNLSTPPGAQLHASDLFQITVDHSGESGNDEVFAGWCIRGGNIAENGDVEHRSATSAVKNNELFFCWGNVSREVNTPSGSGFHFW
jgi:hypothetical protein